MAFVTILETTQNRNGVLDIWLLHQNRLEATFQSRIFFDVLAILIQRGCTDTV